MNGATRRRMSGFSRDSSLKLPFALSCRGLSLIHLQFPMKVGLVQQAIDKRQNESEDPMCRLM